MAWWVAILSVCFASALIYFLLWNIHFVLALAFNGRALPDDGFPSRQPLFHRHPAGAADGRVAPCAAVDQRTGAAAPTTNPVPAKSPVLPSKALIASHRNVFGVILVHSPARPERRLIALRASSIGSGAVAAAGLISATSVILPQGLRGPGLAARAPFGGGVLDRRRLRGRRLLLARAGQSMEGQGFRYCLVQRGWRSVSASACRSSNPAKWLNVLKWESVMMRTPISCKALSAWSGERLCWCFLYWHC